MSLCPPASASPNFIPFLSAPFHAHSAAERDNCFVTLGDNLTVCEPSPPLAGTHGRESPAQGLPPQPRLQLFLNNFLSLLSTQSRFKHI